MSEKKISNLQEGFPHGKVHQVHAFVDFWLGQQLRALRKEKGISLQDLARASAISVGTLSQVERGLTSASIKTLSRLSSSLGVSINRLLANVEPQEHEFHGWIARANQHRTLEMKDRNIIKEVITPAACSLLDLYRVRMKPGGTTGTDLFVTEAQEIAGTVIEGVMELWIGTDSVVLRTGDSFYYPGRAPRRWGNPGSTENYVVWAVARRTQTHTAT